MQYIFTLTLLFNFIYLKNNLNCIHCFYYYRKWIFVGASIIGDKIMKEMLDSKNQLMHRGIYSSSTTMTDDQLESAFQHAVHQFEGIISISIL